MFQISSLFEKSLLLKKDLFFNKNAILIPLLVTIQNLLVGVKMNELQIILAIIAAISLALAIGKYDAKNHNNK